MSENKHENSREENRKKKGEFLLKLLKIILVLSVVFCILILVSWVFKSLGNWTLSFFDLKFRFTFLPVLVFISFITSAFFLYLSFLHRDTPSSKTRSNAMKYEEDSWWIDSHTDHDDR